MANLYTDIIKKRRATGNQDGSNDMLWALMEGRYKDGTKISDEEMSNLMIALLMVSSPLLQKAVPLFTGLMLLSPSTPVQANGDP